MKTPSLNEITAETYELKRNRIAKEPVKIRFRKLAGGSRSVYLTINENGRRTYQYLRLYLVPEIDAAAKEQNKKTMEAVYAIKAQCTIQIINGIAGIKKDFRAAMPLVDWLKAYGRRQTMRGRIGAGRWVDSVVYALTKYHKTKETTLADTDRRWLEDFMLFLRNDYMTYKNTRPTDSTIDNYMRCLKAALNAAVSEGIIATNPMTSLDRSSLRVHGHEREYLTLNEVKLLIAAPCRSPVVKRAFLFACFCGLRISDIRRLRWENIVYDGSKIYIRLSQQKTGEYLVLPLNRRSAGCLPPRGMAADCDSVFSGLPRNMTVLSSWVKTAGIRKHVTFHVSRHTFATMALTLGADIYTTSKLLGHRELRTTQIYARIVDSKKEEAVSLLDSAFE